MRPKPQQPESAQPVAQSVGTLVSVNLGMPKNVPWQGKNVYTGVFKDPMHRPPPCRQAQRRGRWSRRSRGARRRASCCVRLPARLLSVLGTRARPERLRLRTSCGENFTVEGLGDDEVCIGDRYKIGTAVFEVTQPRVTCYRVGIRMNDPRIPALLVSHHRPGFYFRVLEEGDVQAGDKIIKLASGSEQMPVAEAGCPALPPWTHAPATASGASDPRPQSWLAGVVPRSARGGTRERQRRSRGDEPAAGLAWFPSS